MHTHPRPLSILAVAASAVLAPSTALAGDGVWFEHFGLRPDLYERTFARVTAMSRDGSVVIAQTYDGGFGFNALNFRWTREAGPEPIDTGEMQVRFRAVSGDGSVAIGSWDRAYPALDEFPIAVRYGVGSPAVRVLGPAGGGIPGATLQYSYGVGISEDGSTALGWAYVLQGGEFIARLLIWPSPETVSVLPGQPGSDLSVQGLSADGRRAYSLAYDPVLNQSRWSVWQDGQGPQAITHPFWKRSPYDHYTAVIRPERAAWSAQTGLVSTQGVTPIAVSDTGVVVGWGSSDGVTGEAFLWDASRGPRSLKSVLLAAGLDVSAWRFDPTSWEDLPLFFISSDGRTVAGQAINPQGTPEAFVARLPIPCRGDFNGDGRLDPDDLSDYITCYFTEPTGGGACAGVDVDGSGSTDPDDLADFITAYFEGCS